MGLYNMKRYEKFKVGQEVRVVRKIAVWQGASWVSGMNKTMNKIYKIKDVDEYIGCLLDTANDAGRSYWYSSESLACVVGQQLLFSFMEG